MFSSLRKDAETGADKKDLTMDKTPEIPALNPDIPRRAIDIPGMPGRPGLAHPDSPMRGQTERNKDGQRSLTVGPNISLSGEISDCDHLIVEGTLDARVRDATSIEVAGSGLFRGNISIEEAVIAGRYEGELTVAGKLLVRASGRITGSVKYGELEIESGGQIYGQIQGPDVAETNMKGKKEAVA